MAKEETDIVHAIQIDASPFGARLFKNVRGLFWSLDKTHKVKAGLLAPGASDLIGATPVVITQEMVGSTVAVFTVIEVKTEDGEMDREGKQQHFIDVIRKIGGFAGVARCPADARKIMKIPVDSRHGVP